MGTINIKVKTRRANGGYEASACLRTGKKRSASGEVCGHGDRKSNVDDAISSAVNSLLYTRRHDR